MAKLLFSASAASHLIQFHLPYFQELLNMGYEIHTVSQGIIQSELVKKSFSLNFYKGRSSWKNLFTLPKLIRILNQEKYDLISSHAMLAGCMTRVAATLSRHKSTIFHTCHGYLFRDDGSLKSKIILEIEYLLGRCTDLLFVMNHEDEAIARKHKLCSQIKFINGMGLDMHRFKNIDILSANEKRRELHIPANAFVFLSVGEFSPRKSQMDTILAFKKVLDESPSSRRNTFLLFAGEGVLLEKCCEMAVKLGIDANLIFCGYEPNIELLYAVCDVVVSTSKYEGLPFNILESLAMGKPVIASCIKGHVDLIAEGKNGMLFPYGDVSFLAKCMLELLHKVRMFDNISLPENYELANVKSEILKEYEKLDKNFGKGHKRRSV